MTKGALETRFEWGGDFGAPDETYISSKFDKPVMVHHYPAAVKAFYMARDPERAELALGVDVLAPEGYGEVIGGGERATSLEFLKEQIALHRTAAGSVSSGISTCAATAAFRTRVSAWASSAARPGCAASSTFAKRFRSRACFIGFDRSSYCRVTSVLVTDVQSMSVSSTSGSSFGTIIRNLTMTLAY